MKRLALIALAACHHHAAPAPTTAPVAAAQGDEYADLAAFCAGATADGGECATAEPIGSLASPAAPYLAATLFWAGDSETTPSNSCYLGIQTAHGWTVASVADDCWGNGKYYRRLTVDQLDVEDLAHGGSAELVLRYTVESEDPMDEGPTSASEQHLVVCGLDADALPRCTTPLAADATVTALAFP